MLTTEKLHVYLSNGHAKSYKVSHVSNFLGLSHNDVSLTLRTTHQPTYGDRHIIHLYLTTNPGF